MHICKKKEALKNLIQPLKKKGLSIGLVPTMGALHQGHVSLIQQALASCDKVVVSIFVNPTQFDNDNDLQKYPRDLESDIFRLSQFTPEVILFAPPPSEIYGKRIASEHFTFDGLEHEMEGKHRTGHFDGVGTVVKKLFEIVRPDKAFFGQKDFQQLQIIRKLVEKLQLEIEIVGCPIEREITGLARSSRNERLDPDTRQNLGLIYQILLKAKEQFGTKSASEINNWVRIKFKENPNLELEYFEIANEASLKTIQKKEEGVKYRAFIAVHSGDIRLIDNIALN